jgi:hypothetical protein
MYAQTEMFSKSQDFTATTLRLEEVPAIYYAYTGQPITIQAGDFIRARRLPMVSGWVVARIELHLGRKQKLNGYRVQLASGRIDFIPADDAELCGIAWA